MINDITNTIINFINGFGYSLKAFIDKLFENGILSDFGTMSFIIVGFLMIGGTVLWFLR